MIGRNQCMSDFRFQGKARKTTTTSLPLLDAYRFRDTFHVHKTLFSPPRAKLRWAAIRIVRCRRRKEMALRRQIRSIHFRNTMTIGMKSIHVWIVWKEGPRHVLIKCSAEYLSLFFYVFDFVHGDRSVNHSSISRERAMHWFYAFWIDERGKNAPDDQALSLNCRRSKTASPPVKSSTDRICIENIQITAMKIKYQSIDLILPCHVWKKEKHKERERKIRHIGALLHCTRSNPIDLRIDAFFYLSSSRLWSLFSNEKKIE